ncbi:L10-interacting MYB domain-containing protein-like [Magnolia sinica]|uniref:L10-interacting MYB domain-containing protein-like n=1 Tax=Magnolia sinica TaxID=86752 RepID=UPI002658975D|nr:L10-interacting MYB domain-containing protein-like [Magnolia sinica]
MSPKALNNQSTPTKQPGQEQSVTPRRTPRKYKSKSLDDNVVSGGVMRWMYEMDDYLIDTLMDVVANDRKSANGFKKETYKTVVETVKSALGISVQEKHVGNCLRTLKRLYFEIRDTLNASGFGWDEDNKLLTAPDDVWEDYIRSHPYAQHIRGKAVRRYDDLTYLFGNDRATGSRASTRICLVLREREGPMIPTLRQRHRLI